MKSNFAPKTILGKWSVGLNTFFLIVVLISIIFVKLFRILSFDDHWWDVTVLVVFPASIIAFFTGIRAIIKNKERSVLVFLSVLISISVILFLIFHSLFIND